VGKVSRWWLSFLHHLEFAHALLDKFSVWQGDLTLGSFTWHDKEPLKTLLQSGKGAVVLSAHLGNIETIRAISTELQNITINALMFRAHNPHFNAVLPPSSQLRIVPTENLGPELLFDLQERVKNGEAVSMLADRLLPGSPEKGVAVQFFGSEAQFPAGPFVVASLLECPVFLVFCVRTGRDRYEVTFERFCNPLTLPRNKRQEALRDVVATFAHRLEHHTRKHPLQWFNFYDFWSLPVSLTVSPTPPPLAPSE
jgi:predicted LPLAT superfamily acyltransferase